jgi:hypothetical protein
MSITEVPARSRYTADASSISLGPATTCGPKTIAAMARLLLHRWGLLPSELYLGSSGGPAPRG